MAEIEGTKMVLEVVDLQCCKCFRKIKSLLCRYREIRDQEYDQKKDTVTINVFSCTPERFRQKLICKGGKTIKNIHIVVPPASKPHPGKPDPKPMLTPTEGKKPPEPNPNPKPTPLPAAPDPKPNPNPNPKPTPLPAAPDPNPKLTLPPAEPKPEPKPPKRPPEPPVLIPAPMPGPDPFPCYPPPAYSVPVRTCCTQCYEGYQDGPCYQGYGTPPPPPPPLGYYGGPCYCGCGYYYVPEENPPPCSVM